MYNYSTVANSSLFQTTSHLTQTLLKYSVLNIDKIAELQQTVHSILKRLKASELESLLRALESRGGDVSKCVFVPSGAERVSEPEVTLYQIFRQPSIASANDLKPLAVCSHRDGKRTKVCINPYHYSLLVHMDSSSEKKSVVMFESKDEESSGIDSNYSDFTRSTVCTSLGNSTSSLCESEHIPKFKDWPKRSWCCIAYWEHNERVGPLYYESEDILNVFETLPVLKAKGLCLATLNKPTSRVENVIKRVRHHIGYGLQLSREQDGVWMYNRSDYALFANGPTLTERTSDVTCRQNVLVHKVPPGYSLRLWDYNSSHLSTYRHCAPRSVRVSFAKGWGNTATSSYRRQFVTSCPCWIEIHFFV